MTLKCMRSFDIGFRDLQLLQVSCLLKGFKNFYRPGGIVVKWSFFHLAVTYLQLHRKVNFVTCKPGTRRDTKINNNRVGNIWVVLFASRTVIKTFCYKNHLAEVWNFILSPNKLFSLKHGSAYYTPEKLSTVCFEMFGILWKKLIPSLKEICIFNM